MNFDEIYDRCLTAHALRWIESYRNMDQVVYLEMLGGPIISHCIERYGLLQVIEDFMKKAQSER
jgi:hypothetical protein